MCGICGYTGPVIHGRLRRMKDLIAHRGPDGKGCYADPLGRAHLGHRRLSIIDLATGDQPTTNEEGNIWVVFNGEIYNYKELRSELVRAGHHLRTTSDTETLVHLYEDYGLGMLSHLNGMFAFALWDERQGRLLLARDRLGVKPLYWGLAGDRLIFASEMKSVLCWPEVDRDVNPRALSLFLSLRNVPEPLTIYQGIQALPPAHYLTWQLGAQAKIARYWSLDFTPQPWPDEEDLCDRLEELLLDATRIRMRSDVPVGAYLSGGVDSSLVVALTRKFHAGDLQTFCLAYQDRPAGKNDAVYARSLARRFQTNHHEHLISAGDVVRQLPRLAWHLEQPFAGVVSTFFLTELVRQHVKVVLTGDGADDLFGSYGHHRLVWPLANLEQARARGALDPFTEADLEPLADRPDFIRQFYGRQPWEWRASFGAYPDDEKLAILSPDFKAWVREYSASDFLHHLWAKGTARDPLNQSLEVDVQTLLPNEILVFGDRLSMAHSVEARSPYLDYRFAELAATIPGTLKIKGNILKYILKKTAARHLPQEILNRPKEGFVLPMHIWLRGQIDSLLEELLSPQELSKHGIFDQGRVGQLLHEHRNQIRDHTFRIWALIMFQAWYRAFGQDFNAVARAA